VSVLLDSDVPCDLLPFAANLTVMHCMS
jgi:hypothetical protein